MFEKLLEYQKLDGKLLNLKRSLESDTSKQTLNKVITLVKDEQNKLLSLEAKAKSTINDYEKAKSEYEKAYETFNKLSKFNDDNLNEDQLTNHLENLNKLLNTLSLLERSLSSQAEAVNLIIKSFETCRNNIVNFKQKYKDCKANYDKFEATVKPQYEEIKKQMLEMEKTIDKNMLAKYKHLRQDRIFPVLVPLNQNACGGCSMSLPAALMNKLKSEGYLECEQCRRYIYLV